MEDLSKYNPEGSILRKAQLRMLEILIAVDKICRKHHIDYFLDSGTLIGAVRHKGFIPWDDDLDIAIRREDFPRLQKALKEELPSNYCYQDMSTDDQYHLTISKVRDRNSIFYDQCSMKMKERGLFIDIFMVEPTMPRWIRKPVDHLYIYCLNGIHGFKDGIMDKMVGYLCYPLAITAVWICRVVAKAFNVRTLGWQYGWYNHLYVLKEEVFPVCEIEFERHTFFAPNDTDSYLRKLYGDYMQIPPIEKRPKHGSHIEFLDDVKE